MREDDLRATFQALHDQGTPRRPFEAADVIRQGARKRRGHMLFAVLGTGFATAAAVVVALVLLPTPGQLPSEPVPPAKPPVTSVESTTTSPLPTTPQSSLPTSTPSTSVTPPDTNSSTPATTTD